MVNAARRVLLGACNRDSNLDFLNTCILDCLWASGLSSCLFDSEAIEFEDPGYPDLFDNACIECNGAIVDLVWIHGRQYVAQPADCHFFLPGRRHFSNSVWPTVQFFVATATQVCASNVSYKTSTDSPICNHSYLPPFCSVTAWMRPLFSWLPNSLR